MVKQPGFPHPTGFEALHWACVEALSAIRHGEETDSHLAHLTNVLNMARNRQGMMPLVPDPPRDRLSEAEEEAARLRRERDQLREALEMEAWRLECDASSKQRGDWALRAQHLRSILDATTPEEAPE